MKTKKRTYNTQRIKRNYSYTIEEIGELFQIHRNCVRNWIKKGLPTIDKQKPYMIHDSALRAFIKTQQDTRKHPCKPDEFYCLKCKRPRRSFGNLVDLKILNTKQLKIIGFCEVCETVVSRTGALDKVPEYKKLFHAHVLASQHIIDSTNPSYNCYLTEDGKNGSN